MVLARRLACCLALVLVASSGLGASALAGGNKVLFHDLLQKPSSAIAPQRAAGLSIEYVNSKLHIESIGTSGFVFVTPKFAGNGPQLTAVHINVDVSLGPTTAAGLFCRGPNQNSFYAFLVTTDRTYVINKVNGGNETGLTSSNIAAAKEYHLSVACSGAAQPGPTGPVRMSFISTTPSERDKATFTDTTSALDAGPVGLVVAGQAPHSGAASFSNLTVTQG